MTLVPNLGSGRNPDDWMNSMAKVLPEHGSYDEIKSLIKDILIDHPNEVTLSERVVKGIMVRPGGDTKIEFETITGPTSSLDVTATPLEFTVKTVSNISKGKLPDGPANDSSADHFQDTLHYSVNRTGAAIFFNWLRANLAQAKKMNILEFKTLWSDLKIPFDSH